MSAAQPAEHWRPPEELDKIRKEQAAKAAGLQAIVAGGLGAVPLGMILRPVQQRAPGLMGWAAGKLERIAGGISASNGLAFSPDGRHLLAGTRAVTLALRDATRHAWSIRADTGLLQRDAAAEPMTGFGSFSVAGLVFGPEAARGEIEAQMRGLIGEAGAVSLQALLASVNRPTDGLVATLFGLGLMLVGATTVFAELQDTLDHIWRAPARPASGLWSLLRARVLSFGLILGVGFLLVVSLLFNTVLAVVQHWWAPGLGEAFAGVAGQAASFTLMTLLFAMIYKIMPRARIAWADVWIGALVTAGLLGAGRHGIGLLIATSGAAAGYGAAGSLVVLLLWVYYSAQIFLLGAEFTWVYAHALGSHRGTAAVRA